MVNAQLLQVRYKRIPRQLSKQLRETAPGQVACSGSTVQRPHLVRLTRQARGKIRNSLERIRRFRLIQILV
jgi:hypothetical protein